MTDTSIPTFVVVICFASGLLLIAAGIPLWLRRVPPNALYGVRFASTLSDERIWYEINARCGRDLVAIGAGYLALLTAAFLFGHSWPAPFRLLGPTVVLVVALIVNTVQLSRAAARLVAERDMAGIDS
ncbi:MAG TPA: SdpI family protein [Gemmatimonadaceae bacterium]|nr:SdpI family protein [Gemmatimonadaceae bacterium]